MKRLLTVLSLFYLFSNICLAQGTIAVVELDALGISTDESQALTDRLRFELYRSGNFTVIERGLMEEILQEQGFQQTGCVSDECVVEVGKLLGAESMVGGSISKVGLTYSVGIRVVSVETGEVLASAQKDFKGEIDYLLTDGIAIVVNDLITSLGAKQLRQLTTAKMPLQHYGFLIGGLNLVLKPSEDTSVSGLGIEFGLYKNHNILSMGVGPYWSDIFTDDPTEYEGFKFLSANIKYRRFFPNLSIPLPTLKAVKIITPFVLANLENIIRWWYYEFRVEEFKRTEKDVDNYGMLKGGVGFTMDISSKHTFHTEFAFTIVGRETRYASSHFNFGITFTQFPKLW